MQRLLRPWRPVPPPSSGCARRGSPRAWKRRCPVSSLLGGSIANWTGPRRPSCLLWLVSAPPEGRARWTLKLLADKLVALDIVDTIRPECVRTTLKKTSLNRGSSSMGDPARRPTPRLSVRWKTCWRSTRARTIPGARRCAWTRRANNWWQKPAHLSPPPRGSQSASIMNTSGRARRICLWCSSPWQGNGGSR